MKKASYVYIFLLLSGILACENRDVNEAEQFKPREIHEDIVFHFDTILVDGVEYLILEKDNNNPHEGFGFMAFRGNRLMEKQDTVLAYLKTITDLQVEILAAVSKRPVGEVNQRVNEILLNYIEAQRSELLNLQSTHFQNMEDTAVNYLPK